MFPIIYLLLNFVIYAFLILFIIPHWEKDYEIYMVVATLVLSFSFWIISSLKNPGIVTKHPAYDLLVSTYLIFGKPTTYSRQLATIDPNFEEFLRYVRHDSTESIFDNPLKVVNDKLYQNRSFMEETRKIAGNQTAKLQTIKENLVKRKFEVQLYRRSW